MFWVKILLAIPTLIRLIPQIIAIITEIRDLFPAVDRETRMNARKELMDIADRARKTHSKAAAERELKSLRDRIKAKKR